MDTIDELCSFEGRLAGTDAERRAAQPRRRAPALPRAPRRRGAHLRPPAGAAGLGRALRARVRRQPRRRRRARRRVRARPARGDLALPRPQHPPLPAPPPLLPPRLAERRLARPDPGRPGPPAARRPLRRRAHRLDPPAEAGRPGRAVRPRSSASTPPGSCSGRSRSCCRCWARAWPASTSDLVAILQLPPTLLLLVAMFLLVDIQLSRVVPGANDNASGVAVALSLAERLRDEPAEHLDVWVVLTGGEECGARGHSLVHPRAAQGARPRIHLRPRDRLGRRRRGPLGRRRGTDRLVRHGPQAARALRRGRRSRPRGRERLPRRARSATASAATPSRPGCTGWRATAITCLEPGSHGAGEPPPPADLPDADRPGGARPRRARSRST